MRERKEVNEKETQKLDMINFILCTVSYVTTYGRANKIILISDRKMKIICFLIRYTPAIFKKN